MAIYQSDVTQFLNKLKAERPHLEEEQRKGRAIWWDREPLDMEKVRQNQESRVLQQAYPYQSRG
jgi:Protein of unknown function (DUF3460)